MTKLSWNKLPLKDLFRLDTTSCLPASQPEQAFLHHSIPAWDESGGPVVELGNTIGSNKFLISHPCILVSKLNPRKSRVSVVRDLSGEFPQCASTEFMVYVPIHEDADIGFYGLYMTSEYFQSELKRVATGTTNSHVRVTPKETLNWKIAQPPLPEQRRIAEILDTIDEAIQKTEALISKLKAMKQGLLHDLLTRGLDKNGKLRDPKAHPEQFKDLPLGRIPREWKVEKLGEICRRTGGSVQTGPFGSQLHAKDYKDRGIPIITVEHLGDNQIIYNNLPLVGRMDYERLERYRIETGDLVFSRVGAIDRCAYVSEQENGWLFSGRCLRVRTGGNFVNPRFLSFQLNSYGSRKWILNHSVGSTMACLNTSILSEVPVSLPPIQEQRAIALLLDAHDACIRTEEGYRDKLKLQKKGLMHDLLTGKVRVKV